MELYNRCRIFPNGLDININNTRNHEFYYYMIYWINEITKFTHLQFFPTAWENPYLEPLVRLVHWYTQEPVLFRWNPYQVQKVEPWEPEPWEPMVQWYTFFGTFQNCISGTEPMEPNSIRTQLQVQNENPKGKNWNNNRNESFSKITHCLYQMTHCLYQMTHCHTKITIFCKSK